MEKSKGHRDFLGEYEYFQVQNDIYRAYIDSPVMPDGYRCGRFYCPIWQWKDQFNRLNTLFIGLGRQLEVIK